MPKRLLTKYGNKVRKGEELPKITRDTLVKNPVFTEEVTERKTERRTERKGKRVRRLKR